ncbi:MAG: NUDIX hydrolase [bacterium]|nr:NUDIX hydrolase [bacterium]
MTELRIVCRVAIYNLTTSSILFVRNRDQKWWCLPGGGWNHAEETILDCAKREVLEETGVQAKIIKLLCAQTLHIKKQDSIWLEQFWLAEPVGSTKVPQRHIDQYGVVDEARWFSKEEMETIIVYPEFFRTIFWDVVIGIIQEQDRYLGHFVL